MPRYIQPGGTVSLPPDVWAVEQGGTIVPLLAALAEQAVTADPTSTSRPRRPYVPSQPKVRVRWQATWRLVRLEYERGKGYVALADWLSRTHPDLRCSPETLTKIIRAGAAGGLD